jgi:hypothetical protein
MLSDAASASRDASRRFGLAYRDKRRFHGVANGVATQADHGHARMSAYWRAELPMMIPEAWVVSSGLAAICQAPVVLQHDGFALLPPISAILESLLRHLEVDGSSTEVLQRVLIHGVAYSDLLTV